LGKSAKWASDRLDVARRRDLPRKPTQVRKSKTVRRGIFRVVNRKKKPKGEHHKG